MRPKLCPICVVYPRLHTSKDGYLYICPYCLDRAERPAPSKRQAVRDWNSGITPEYEEETASY